MQQTNDVDLALYHQHRFLGRLNLHSGTPPSQFVLYNYVTDYYYYYPDGTHGFLPMRETLALYLDSLGYSVIAIFNTSEGLVFADEVCPAFVEPREQSMRASTQTLLPQAAESDPATIDFQRTNVIPPIDPSTISARAAEPRSRAEVIEQLGMFLRQPGSSSTAADFVRVAIILERVENIGLNSYSESDRQIVDQLQSWAGLTNGNVSILIADVADRGRLPPVLAGLQRSGVQPVSVILPDHQEINRLLIRAERGLLNESFLVAESSVPVSDSHWKQLGINQAQRRDMIAYLEGNDIVAIRGYLLACLRKQVNELNMRNLRALVSRSVDIWPHLLTRRALDGVEQRLLETIRGQEAAIHQVLRRLRAVSHDLEEQANTGVVGQRLLAYFFFAGPTGVGKTEVFRELSRAFPEVRSRQFSMPEYRDEHSAARFFGAPPGYIGYGRGELGDFLAENPAALVLFDEFEKANPAVWRNFLTMLEGHLTTGDGTRIDLSQAIFIFTSNAGSDLLRRIDPFMDTRDQALVRRHNGETVQWALKRGGAPTELISRLLEMIIPFNHMTEEVIADIIHRNLRELGERTKVSFDRSVHASLLDLYSQRSNFGARPVKQHIDNTLKAEILALPLPRGLVYRNSDNITCQTDQATPPEPVYQRTARAVPLVTGQPVQIDVSTPERLQSSANDALVAILICDSQGQHIRTTSGIFVTEDGHILTAQRSIAGSMRLRAWSSSEQHSFELAVVGFSIYDGLAILCPNPRLERPVPFLMLANSGTIDVETPIVAVGFPRPPGFVPGDPQNYRATITQGLGQISGRIESARMFTVKLDRWEASWAGGALLSQQEGDLIGMLMPSRDGGGELRAVMSSSLHQFLRELGLVQPVVRLNF